MGNFLKRDIDATAYGDGCTLPFIDSCSPDELPKNAQLPIAEEDLRFGDIVEVCDLAREVAGVYMDSRGAGSVMGGGSWWGIVADGFVAKGNPVRVACEGNIDNPTQIYFWMRIDDYRELAKSRRGDSGKMVESE